ncbi:IS110 family transposase [Candidatus Parcubacteria bacterium]|nr:MAG: IS110 family transposase [Candidatus Parcubacteria bacterium]
MRYLLGIDISKSSFHAAFLDTAGSDGPQHGEFPNDAAGFQQLSEWLERLSSSGSATGSPVTVHACMEATGRYYEALACFLHQAGHRVSVVNPTCIAHYARSKLLRNKTDKIDAATIADFARTQNPRAWTPPSPQLKQLQALTHQLDALKKMKTQETNRLKAAPPDKNVQKVIREHLHFLEQQNQTLIQQLDSLAKDAPFQRQVQLLTSIPGIGKLTAYRLIAEGITRFDSSRQLAAYAGLSPRHHESGTSVKRKEALSKVGNARLRAALYWPAISAKRWNPALAAFVERLESKHKPNKLITAAVMRKLLCLAFAVLKADKPFDPAYQPH